MCVLSATQVLASAISKSGGRKSVSVGQLIRYNDLLLREIADYFNTIDIGELAFEVSSIAPEFDITVNEDYEDIITVSDGAKFNYSLYERTMPKKVAIKLETIELPM